MRYKRDDGVDLTATLYLPPGHDPARDGPLPTILWAYPREYKSKVGRFALRNVQGTVSRQVGASCNAQGFCRPPLRARRTRRAWCAAVDAPWVPTQAFFAMS